MFGKVLDFSYDKLQTTHMELHSSDSKPELASDSDNGITNFRLPKYENPRIVGSSFGTTKLSDQPKSHGEAEMGVSPTDNLVASPEAKQSAVGRVANWVTLIGVEMPAGSYVHPGFLETMKSQFRHLVPAIDWRTDGVRMSCRMYEEDERSATEASRDIAISVLTMLALDRSALVEFQVVPVARPVEVPRATLRLVR